jgi:hypothetical protein
MGMTTPVDFATAWPTLPPRARIAVVLLAGEQAARDHGIDDEIPAIRHGWMAVEATENAETLISADAFAALTQGDDVRTPPGLLWAIGALLDTPSDDTAALEFFVHCNPADVEAALTAVHEAVTRGTDLTPPAVLQQDFGRRRS